ncbi:LuxR C-terminal-related transcriptional regulator [Rhodococcus jostii]|uniref:LuxR C-terminal-related transcriptional regulator n=1 Tax=Rhodococcus jostii TaxID=132919 RepID=A0ABU4CDV7_RHOJO|nr:LuxR C-terminal-related transcriptional regulator [Rhodococcus jostii]MDV6281598.1 LuxR C-terminal-related transcriptional regulator [Rhodococcus jostii]
MGEGDPLDTQRYPPSPAVELAGTGFDDVQEIGRGGFGVVYRCTQEDLDRTVAVKVLTVELDEENRARFFREQRAMGRLTGHPNIVNILQVGATDSGLPYIVMPYHPQDSLEARVRTGGPLPLDQVLRRRHRDWYEALALDAETEWISARQLDWIARLKREHANLREALEFSIDDDPTAGLRIAVALFLFWSSQGLYNEGRRWYDQLLVRQSGPPTLDSIKGLYSHSVMAFAQGDLQAATALVEEARTRTADTSDPLLRAYVDCADGMLALYSGGLARACSRLETALAVFTARKDRTLEVSILYPLGVAYGLSGRTDQAIECHERALSITERYGEKMYRSHSLWALGIAVWRQGDADRAVGLLEQSLELTRQVRSPRVVAAALEALAWIACERHDAVRAATLMGAAEGLARSVGSAVVIHSNLVVYHQNCEQEVRHELGHKTFGVAHRKGEQLGFDAAIAYALHEQQADTATRDADASTRLTKRERQVADLIAEGLTNQAIADRLVISPRTAQGHVEHILAKLGFTSRTQVAAWVVERAHD